MSQNYPGPYNPNTDCLYIIKPPPGIYKLEVDVFQMADIGDFLEVLIYIIIYYSVLRCFLRALVNSKLINIKYKQERTK